jgi:hypothetical protein
MKEPGPLKGEIIAKNRGLSFQNVLNNGSRKVLIYM